MYCVKSGTFKKRTNLNIFIFDKTLIISFIYRECGDCNDRIFKSIEKLKILGFKFHVHLTNILEKKDESTILLKKVNEARNYFIEEIKQNYLRTKTAKKFTWFYFTLNTYLLLL